MDGHHLIMGEINDFITGEALKDTHDERYRQKVARVLVNQKKYLRSDVYMRNDLQVQAGENRAIVKVDFSIHLADRICMIIKYGPGSIVTRRRPLLAASRILTRYQIPIAVITNGEDAEVLEGTSGAVISQGLDSIPSKPQLMEIVGKDQFNQIPSERAEIESRILYCYEVDGSCPCDDNICRL